MKTWQCTQAPKHCVLMMFVHFEWWHFYRDPFSWSLHPASSLQCWNLILSTEWCQRLKNWHIIGILSEIGHDLLWYTTIRKILFGDDTPRHLQSVFISYMYTWHASLNYMALHECTCIKNIIDIRELTSQKVVQGWVVFSLDEGSQLR